MLIASGYRHSLFRCRNRIESVHSVNQFMLISAYIINYVGYTTL